MSIENPTQYELDTYEGRKICDRREWPVGYCGSCSLECHIKQLNDPDSWVHSSKDRWYRECHLNCLKNFRQTIIVNGEEYVKKNEITKD